MQRILQKYKGFLISIPALGGNECHPDLLGATSLGATAGLNADTTFPDTLKRELDKACDVRQPRFVFHFQSHQNTNQLDAIHLNGTGEAPAKKLFGNYRVLRTMASLGQIIIDNSLKSI